MGARNSPDRGEDVTRAFSIAPMRRRDVAAIRAICVQTCWQGGYRPDAIPADWFWAEYWTRYFTDCEPHHTWVALDHDGEVIGYLTGTSDARRFRLDSGLRTPLHAMRLVYQAAFGPPLCWASLASLAASSLRGETRIPRRLLKRYPATWHFNLLPVARRRGLGSRLVTVFLDQMRREGVTGAHVQPLSSNAVGTLVEQLGFAHLHRHRCTAFRHIEPGPLFIDTWATSL